VARSAQKVPFGYEPPVLTRKGTLIYYDAFEHATDLDLELAAAYASTHDFKELVLYPLHEETVRRMTKEPVSAFYKRLDRLVDWQQHHSGIPAKIEQFEGKRKKYTPIDSALRHVSDQYAAPYFLYLTPEVANQFASYDSFESWIVKLRLVLTEEPQRMHPRLAQYQHRWSIRA